MNKLADLAEKATHEFATIDAWNNGRLRPRGMWSGTRYLVSNEFSF